MTIYSPSIKRLWSSLESSDFYSFPIPRLGMIGCWNPLSIGIPYFPTFDHFPVLGYISQIGPAPFCITDFFCALHEIPVAGFNDLPGGDRRRFNFGEYFCYAGIHPSREIDPNRSMSV